MVKICSNRNLAAFWVICKLSGWVLAVLQRECAEMVVVVKVVFVVVVKRMVVLDRSGCLNV